MLLSFVKLDSLNTPSPAKLPFYDNGVIFSAQLKGLADVYISYTTALQCTWIIIIIIIIIEKHTSEGAKEQKQHKLSYMVEAEDTIKSNSD